MIRVIHPIYNLYKSTDNANQFIAALVFLSLVSIFVFADYMQDRHPHIWFVVELTVWTSGFILAIKLLSLTEGILA